MTLVMGLDLGMTVPNPTGVALIRADGMDYALITTERIVPRAKGWQERVGYVARTLRGLVRQHHPDLLCYELPPLVRDASAAIKLAHIGGVVLAVADLYDLPCEAVRVQDAKMALCGSPLATKANMITATWAQFDAMVEKDEADAAGVALAGYAAWRRRRLEAA